MSVDPKLHDQYVTKLNRVRSVIVRHERSGRRLRNAEIDGLLMELHDALGDHEPERLPGVEEASIQFEDRMQDVRWD